MAFDVGEDLAAEADLDATVVAIQEDRGTTIVSAFSIIRRTIGVKLQTTDVITTITAITTVVILSFHTALTRSIVTGLAA